MGKILKLKSGIILLVVATVLALAIAPATVSAVPTCVDCPGDANGDGQLTASDITMIELVWLYPGTYPPASYPGANADESGDGVVNGSDVQAVVLRILEVWPPNLVYLDAPSSVAANSSFTATVRINMVMDFDAAVLQFSYDPAVLQLTGVNGPGGLRLTTVPLSGWALVPPATQGEVRIVVDIPGTTGATGAGYLAMIDFTVIGSPGQVSALTFNTSECELTDTLGVPITVPSPTWQADSVTVAGGAPTPTPTPTSTPTPTPTPTPPITPTPTPTPTPPITPTPTPTPTPPITPTPTPTPTPPITPTPTPTPTPLMASNTVYCEEVGPQPAGFPFNLKIMAYDISPDVTTGQFDIQYDYNIITVSDVADGDVGGTAIPASGSWALFGAGPGGQGILRFVIVPSGSASGSGYLCDITFDAVLAGPSPLQFVGTLEMYGSGFPPPLLPTTWVDGSVTVVP